MSNYTRPVMRATKWAVYSLECGEMAEKVYEGNFIDCSFYIMALEKLWRDCYVIHFEGFYD